jgi:hypothetical protein
VAQGNEGPWGGGGVGMDEAALPACLPHSWAGGWNTPHSPMPKPDEMNTRAFGKDPKALRTVG